MGLDVVESHVKTFRQGQSPKSTTSTEGYSSPFLNKIIANIQNIIANDTSQSTTKPSLLGINLGKNKLSQEPLKVRYEDVLFFLFFQDSFKHNL